VKRCSAVLVLHRSDHAGRRCRYRRALLRSRGLPEIPIGAISGTLEPSPASLFDGCFQPTKAADQRPERVWLAEHHAAPLPPISVV
jgi:hypothetical protein